MLRLCQGLPVVLSSIETYVGGQPAWERRTRTMSPNTNTVSVFLEEESQRGNTPHLRETFSVLTLTCAVNELSLGVSSSFTNRQWRSACEWVYFQLDSTAVGTHCSRTAQLTQGGRFVCDCRRR